LAGEHETPRSPVTARGVAVSFGRSISAEIDG